jgi:hypothetical protein
MLSMDWKLQEIVYTFGVVEAAALLAAFANRE